MPQLIDIIDRELINRSVNTEIPGFTFQRDEALEFKRVSCSLELSFHESWQCATLFIQHQTNLLEVDLFPEQANWQATRSCRDIVVWSILEMEFDLQGYWLVLSNLILSLSKQTGLQLPLVSVEYSIWVKLGANPFDCKLVSYFPRNI